MLARRMIMASGATGFVGPYDAIADLTNLYEIGRLGVSSYYGNPLVRIRRSSDSSEQDFGHDEDGILDTAAIATFIGAGTGSIVTIYDQIGSSDLTQATGNDQPAYVASGQNGKPAMDFDGTNDTLAGTNTISGTGSRSFIVAAASDVSSGIGCIFDFSSQAGPTGTPFTLTREIAVRCFGRTWVSTTGLTDFSMISGVFTANPLHSGLSLWKNGASIARTSGTDGNINTGANSTTLGFSLNGTTFFNGHISMLAIANDDWSTAERQAMEAAVDAYYQITGLTLTSPASYQTFQRDGLDQADIAISGTYVGAPTAIEASFNGGAYTTIDASPSAGAFSGTLSNQDAGQGTLTVRFANDTSKSDSALFVGIGDVFLVAGQSNAQGHADNNQSYSHASLKAAVYDESDTWRECTDPTDSDVAFGSPWPLLATLHMADQGVPVAFITAADGSTGLVTPDDHWTKNNASYAAAITRITNSGVNDIKAMLWYQGERDIVNGTSAAAYQTALSLMLDDFQTDTGFSSMVMIAACVALYGTEDDASINAIRTAIINRWINDADIYPGPTGHTENFSDGLHWETNAEVQRLANRWWRAIDAALFGGAEAARGPQFSSATRSGTTVTVTFTGGEGNLASQTDETGFLFTDNGTPITINSAAANGTNAVDLTLASTPAGTELISFANGNDAAGATLSDSGTYPLPPEPFVDEAVS